MSETLIRIVSEKRAQRARFRHTCSACGNTIQAGDLYSRYTTIDPDDLQPTIHTYRTHLICPTN